MIKSIALALGFLMVSPAAVAGEPWELTFPSLEEQIQMGIRIKFENLVSDVQTLDYFAGVKTTLVDPQGAEVIVDRTSEALKRTPGNPPPRLESLVNLLDSIDVAARGRVRIQVQRTFYENGAIKSENWTIDVGGSWEVSSGMGDAMDKQHK